MPTSTKLLAAINGILFASCVAAYGTHIERQTQNGALISLIAVTTGTVNPDVYVLDYNISIEDCGHAIADIKTKGMVWLDDRNAVPAHTVTLACQLQDGTAK